MIVQKARSPLTEIPLTGKSLSECVVISRACRKRENCFARKRARKKSLRLRMYKGGIPRLTVLCEHRR